METAYFLYGIVSTRLGGKCPRAPGLLTDFAEEAGPVEVQPRRKAGTD